MLKVFGIKPIHTALMLFLYDIAIRCYFIVIKIAALFNGKAQKWITGRRDWLVNLEIILANQSNPIIWMHCASLGEFEQGRPILEQLRKSYPKHFLLLTFYSPSGYDIRKEYEGVDHVAYLPLDTRANSRNFLDIVKPRLVIFVKYEFWYHFLKNLQQRKIPTLLISAIFRKEQIFFRPHGGLFREMLKCFTHLFVQEEESKNLLAHKPGLTNVTVCGDTRVDRVLYVVKQERYFPVIEQFSENKKILICGSTWPEDEQLVADWFASATKEWNLIMAPHDIQESRLLQIEQQFSGDTFRYSQLHKTMPSSCQVLIIDNIGMLSALYHYARVAYVGGGFGSGIHNILEPAAYALPICFGPKYYKFEEAKQLIKRGGAFVIERKGDLEKTITNLETDNNYVSSGTAVRKFMEESKGATTQIMAYVDKLL